MQTMHVNECICSIRSGNSNILFYIVGKETFDKKYGARRGYRKVQAKRVTTKAWRESKSTYHIGTLGPKKTSPSRLGYVLCMAINSKGIF